jgi:dCMP deaminase
MRTWTPRTRMSKDEAWLRNAFTQSMRGTCIRRQVGCILVDGHGDMLASGFNGPPRGWPHCNENPCPGASAAPGQGLSQCEAVHGEANALLQCRDPYAIDTAYCTDSPCLDCVKLLLNTSCHRIVFLREYAHPEAKERWHRVLSTNGLMRGWWLYPDGARILNGG